MLTCYDIHRRKSASGSINYIPDMLPSNILINEKWIIYVIISTVHRTTLTVMHNIDNVCLPQCLAGLTMQVSST